MSQPELLALAADISVWPELERFVDSPNRAHHAQLARALLAGGHPDLESAVADGLMYGDSAAWALASEAPGLQGLLEADLGAIVHALAAVRAVSVEGDSVPALEQLAPENAGDVLTLANMLRESPEASQVYAWVQDWRTANGGGRIARYRAFRWTDGQLQGVAHPVEPNLDHLVGVERQVDELRRNTEAFLRGNPAMHVLLYGARGSGKSTVVRGLLARYAEQGLRLIELPSQHLTHLPDVLRQIAGRPERFVVFVDDLAFEAGDARYQPIKSLLDGSIEARPSNVRLYATSNRRHLLQERLRDRPDPLDDDVHAWDTQHERLALSDRFGLVVTFPIVGRDAYLDIVRSLVEVQAQGAAEGEDLAMRADRFARSGNGYSGRTAQQFVDALRSGLT